MANGIVLNIDTTKSEFQNPMVQLRQGDGNYQSLDVTVTSNGEPFDLTGWTTTFMGTTAGGFKIVDSAVTVTNALQGEFTYTPTKAWGQNQGEFKNAYFKFTKADETASGASFRVNVLDAVDLTAEEAGNYISVVDVLIDDVKTSMENKLEETKQTLDDTQSQANTVQKNVNDLNTNVNELKTQNLSIKTTDNTWTGENTFSKTVKGVIANFEVDDSVVSVSDLVKHAINSYGSNFNVSYICKGKNLLGSPTKGLYFNFDVKVRDSDKVYISASDENGNVFTATLTDKSGYYANWNSYYYSEKLKYMGMSMTYNENEESRLSQVISAYSGTVKQVSLTNMVSISGNTSSDPVSSTYQKIQTAIHNITDAGMKVIMLKPHIGPNRNDGFAKFKYIPDDINAFFTAYKAILLMQAQLCVDNNIPILSVSNELDSIIHETYKNYWSDIISSLRSSYPNLLLTAAVAGAYGENQKVIYNLVDIIGINWYPEYYYGKINGVVDIPSNDVLSQMLLNYHANDSENPDAKKDIFYFSQLAETLNKPIYFTETGIMPTTDGLNQLLTTQTTTNFYEAQSAMLEAFWSTIAPSKNVVGINYWHAQEPFNITDLNNNITSVAELTWIKLQEEYLQ